MGKDLFQRKENEHKNESDSEGEHSNESSDRDDNCADNADENDSSTSESISTKHVFSNNQIPRANTVWGASPSFGSFSVR